jgi:hypothetical protein
VGLGRLVHAASCVLCFGHADIAVSMAAFGRLGFCLLASWCLAAGEGFGFLVDDTVAVCAPASRAYGVGKCGLLCLLMVETNIDLGCASGVLSGVHAVHVLACRASQSTAPMTMSLACSARESMVLGPDVASFPLNCGVCCYHLYRGGHALSRPCVLSKQAPAA